MEKKWERNDKLKSRTRKITQSELNRENRPKKKKMNRALGIHGDITKDLTFLSQDLRRTEEKE